MSKKFYVTTPIYYPSSQLHLGHAYTTTIADVLARYKSSQGYEVFFLTGSDEHGQKIAKKSSESNVSPQEFVDKVVAEFKDLWKKLNIEYTDFIRTTSSKHISTVQKVFSFLLKNDYVYLGKYEGIYCVSCEEFLTESQVNDNKTCKTCGHEVSNISEPSYFLKMKDQGESLIDLYKKHPNFLFPETRKAEMLNTFIKPGLHDLSVTRTSFTWGIPVLEDSKHIVYVWIDALLNYLSGLNYLQEEDQLFQTFWADETTEVVQLVGKEITRFHAIYWPVLLKMLKLRNPNTILAHGWITNDEGKMSKSKGNVVDPRILIERYSADAVRLFLLKEISFGNDGKYSHENFLNFYNSYLVNDFGNLVSRVLTMINKYSECIVPEFKNSSTTEECNDLIFHFQTTIKDFQITMDQYQITEAINFVWQLINKLNKAIDDFKPWELFKNEEKDLLDNVLNLLVNGISIVNVLLSPILVNTNLIVQRQLGLKEIPNIYSDNFNLNDISGSTVNKDKNLFARLKIDDEITFLNSQ